MQALAFCDKVFLLDDQGIRKSRMSGKVFLRICPAHCCSFMQYRAVGKSQNLEGTRKNPLIRERVQNRLYADISRETENLSQILWFMSYVKLSNSNYVASNFFLGVTICISSILDKCSMLERTQSQPNHTSKTKVYFNEFVANIQSDNIGSV